MNAECLLSEIIVQNAPASTARYQSLTSFTQLIKGGYIEEVGVVQSTHCDDCFQPHDAQVVFEVDQYGIHCPDLGFIAKQRSELIAVQPNLKRLVSSLAETLRCKRTKSTPIQGPTWRVGLVSEPSADVTVYFQPTMRDMRDLQSFEAALTQETKPRHGIVLTAFGEMAPPPFRTLRIADYFGFDPDSQLFEFEGDLAAIAGAPLKRQGGRPSPFNERLSRIITERRRKGVALAGVNEEARAIIAIIIAS